MKCIAENYLCTDLIQFQRAHGFDGAVGTDRHEYRGFNDAMVECQATASCGATGLQQLKFHDIFSGASKGCGSIVGIAAFAKRMPEPPSLRVQPQFVRHEINLQIGNKFQILFSTAPQHDFWNYVK